MQYPGVADSLVSDIDNLATLAKVSGVLPEQLFLDNALYVKLTWNRYEHAARERLEKQGLGG